MKSIFKNNIGLALIWFVALLALQSLIMQNDKLHGQEKAFLVDDHQLSYSSETLNAVLEIKAFFEALREGRVNHLHKMISKKLQDEYGLSFNDPYYPQLLKNIYGDSKMIIDKIHKKENGSFEIYAMISSPRSGIMKFYFELDFIPGQTRNERSYKFRALDVKY